MHNVYQQFRELLPDPPLQAGTVTAVGAGILTVQLPGGAQVTVRGEAQVGQNVFFRDGVVEGVAPSLTLEVIEI
mgnify:CR=1 FL=1|jgi:hypothetical protein